VEREPRARLRWIDAKTVGHVLTNRPPPNDRFSHKVSTKQTMTPSGFTPGFLQTAPGRRPGSSSSPSRCARPTGGSRSGRTRRPGGRRHVGICRVEPKIRRAEFQHRVEPVHLGHAGGDERAVHRVQDRGLELRRLPFRSVSVTSGMASPPGDEAGRPAQDPGSRLETAIHSMTSSARASNAGGIVTPSAFAVLRLMTSWNLVGSSTGRSPGRAPFRILST
jgi:hypothetical protein